MLEATTRTIPVSSSRRPSLLVAAWMLVGITVAFSGIVATRPQLAPMLILASVIGWTIAYSRRGPVRAWLDNLPLRPLIALHAIRLPIGAVFLWESSQGRLPALFANRAGWGDMAIGALAIGTAAVAAKRPRVVTAFAVVGLADILLVLGTAMYLLFVAQDPLMMTAFERLPYPLLPTVIVPAVITTHLLMLARRGR